MNTDQEGNIPLWEAMQGNHEAVVKLLREHGAYIRASDGGQYACIAAEKNNLDLLKKIVRYGGDVTLPASTYVHGGTALHVAVSEGNIEIANYLLDQGSDIDKHDMQGWTPRSLAEQQGHQDITALFQCRLRPMPQTTSTIPAEPQKVHFLGRFSSEPTLAHLDRVHLGLSRGGLGGSPVRARPKVSSFENSIFGVMSTAQNANRNDVPEHPMAARVIMINRNSNQDGGAVRKVVALPKNFEELLEVAVKKFGFLPCRVESECGAEIDCIEVVRDGDHLVLIKDLPN